MYPFLYYFSFSIPNPSHFNPLLLYVTMCFFLEFLEYHYIYLYFTAQFFESIFFRMESNHLKTDYFSFYFSYYLMFKSEIAFCFLLIFFLVYFLTLCLYFDLKELIQLIVYYYLIYFLFIFFCFNYLFQIYDLSFYL